MRNEVISRQDVDCETPVGGASPSRPQGDVSPDSSEVVSSNILSTMRPVAGLADTLDASRRPPHQDSSPTAWPFIPDFEILGELGRGGMGVVYKARQQKLQRVVALKMMLAVGQGSGDRLGRFRTEAEAVARLQHPNVVQIYEVGDYEGLPFLALEYCPGGSLADRLDGTPVSARSAARVVESVARAVHAAHEVGIVHRDLKPANILIVEGASTPGTSPVPLAEVTLKLTDFGLAKKMEEQGLTATGVVLGTPSYLAPEQGLGHANKIGPAADVYALGAILYELLTGRPPFKGETTLDTIMQAVSREPVAPTRLNSKVPLDLETICLKCLEKSPAGRYSSAALLAEDLHRYQVGEPIRARPLSVVGRSIRWGKRRPTVAALIALLTATVVIGFSLVSILYLSATQAAASAQANFDVAEQLRKQADDSATEHARLRLKAEDDAKEHARLRKLADDSATEHAAHRAKAEKELAEQQLLTQDSLLLLEPGGQRKAALEKSPAAFALPYRLACAYCRYAIAVRRDSTFPETERSKIAAQYEARAMLLLNKAYRAGTRPEERGLILTDPDLGNLRGREEFKRLGTEQPK